MISSLKRARPQALEIRFMNPSLMTTLLVSTIKSMNKSWTRIPKVPVFYCLMKKKINSQNFYQKFYFVIFNKSQ